MIKINHYQQEKSIFIDMIIKYPETDTISFDDFENIDNFNFEQKN